MEIALFWIALAVVVGVAANARGRNGYLWFFIAVVVSPLIALLLVLVMQNLRQSSTLVTSTADSRAAALGDVGAPFEPDDVLAGIPYRTLRDGSVEAIIQGARVKFRDMERFVKAASGR